VRLRMCTRICLRGLESGSSFISPRSTHRNGGH
jgi:hypothetical protein